MRAEQAQGPLPRFRAGRAVGELTALAVVAVGLIQTVALFAPSEAVGRWTIACALTGLIYAVSVLSSWQAVHPPRRLRCFFGVTAAVLSALLVVAFSYRTAGGITWTSAEAGTLVGALCAVVAIALVLYRTMPAALLLVRGLSPRFLSWAATHPLRFPTALGLLTVAWIPALIALSPGSTSYDSTRQINELLGVRIAQLDFTYAPTNHHPWFSTVWQGAPFLFGLDVSQGDINVALLFHSVILTVASLLTYAYVMTRIGAAAGPGAAWGMLAILAIIPHFANYAMLFEKTGWYQLALIWFVLGVVDLATGHGRLGFQIVQLAGGGLLTSLFRSNGIYVVAATLLVVTVVSLSRSHRRTLIACCVSIVVVVAGTVSWTNIALPRFGVMPASPAESLIVPFQQVARIVKEHRAEITDAQLEAIDQVLPLDQIVAQYAPENGDNVKGLYPIDSFLITDVGIEKMKDRGDWWNDPGLAEERSDFLEVWGQLVVEFPIEALSATVNNTYLYYAPPLNRGGDVSLFTGGLPDYFVLANPYTEDYAHTAGELPNAALTSYYDVWAKTPGLNLFVNPGLYGWLVIALALGVCFWPSRRRLILLAPVLIVFAINFAGARNGDFRYVVPLVALLPIVISAWWPRRNRLSSV